MILTNQNKSFASESGHWYTLDGKPSYTTIGKNGKERAYTLRDARKDKDRVPSVTTITGIPKNDGLDEWKREKAMRAAWETEKTSLTYEEWKSLVRSIANQQSQEAADLGTSIHASLEKAYQGGDWPAEHDVYVLTTQDAVFDHFGMQSWSAERSFAHPSGFGGKLDLSSDRVVIDFKTSAFDETKKDSEFGYDEHQMQLAAYAYGLGIENPRCANVYISTTVPGLVKIKEWTNEEISQGLDMFMCLLKFWQRKNKYEVSK